VRTNSIIHILLFIVLFIPTITSSQNNLENHKIDFYSKIKHLEINPNELSLNLWTKNFKKDSLIKYCNEIDSVYKAKQHVLNKSQKIFYLSEIASAQSNLGDLYLAIETIKTAIEFVSKNKDDLIYAQLNLKLGDLYHHNGMKKKSNDILLDALDLPVIQADSIAQINCLGLIAENYENLGDNQLAMEISLLLYEFNFAKKDFVAASYNLVQLGRLGSFLETDTTYFEYFHLANSMALKTGDKARIENNLVNTGKAYRKAGFPEIALKYLNKTEEYAIYNSSYGSAYTMLEFSSAYIELDSIQQALKYAKKAMAKAEEIDAYNWLFHANKKMATCYIKMNKLDSAGYCLNKAVSLSKKLNNKNYTVDLFKQLSNISIKQKDFPLAVAYLDSSYKEYAKYISENNNDKLAQLRVESDYHIHRAKIAELVLNNKIEKEKSRKLIRVVLGVILTLFLTALFILLIRRKLKQLKESYRNLVKKNIELDEVNKKLHDCEIRPKKKIKLENIKQEDAIIKKLNELFRKDEVFTNPNLSLKSLADKLQTNTSYLSAAVNSRFNCNLPTLINQYRVDKARKMLVAEEYKHYCVEGIATEVGFKSRTVFYHSFKSITGLSPSLYIENYKLVVSE